MRRGREASWLSLVRGRRWSIVRIEGAGGGDECGGRTEYTVRSTQGRVRAGGFRRLAGGWQSLLGSEYCVLCTRYSVHRSGSWRRRLTISIAARAASKPLLPALAPARLSACSSVSHAGTPVASAACATPLAAPPAT